ncbi:Uncharacterised protein [Mycobacterium tuberculosis]|nr:Uncharacterised protein [Mycobacterium tuberculosis]
MRRPNQGVGRTDKVRACGALVGEPQGGELARHGHRNTDPLRSETTDHDGQLGRTAFDALIGPVVQPQRPVGGQVQLRGAGMRDRGTKHAGFFGTFAHRALSRTPLCLASSMFARCC